MTRVCKMCGGVLKENKRISATSGKKIWQCGKCQKVLLEGVQGPMLDVKEMRELMEIEK